MTPETEHIASPPRSHWRDKVDFMVAICALITSIASIWLSISQGDDMQRLVQAQSWPFLGFNTGNVEVNPTTGKPESVISMEIENLGVGPAKIESLQLWYQGKAITSSDGLLHACCIDAATQEKGTWRAMPILTSSINDRVLRAGQKISLLSWARPDSDAGVWEKLDKARFTVQLKVCYCSVFDECWSSDLQSTQAAPVAECPQVAHPYKQ